MDIVVSHITAFHWYLRNANPLRGSLRQCRMRRLPPVAPSAESARDALLSLSLSDECLNVIVSCESGRRSSEALRSHLYSNNLPPGTAVPLDFLPPGNRLFVSSPEFTFLQLAATYPLEQAAYFGFAPHTESTNGLLEASLSERRTTPPLPQREKSQLFSTGLAQSEAVPVPDVPSPTCVTTRSRPWSPDSLFLSECRFAMEGSTLAT